MRKIKTISENRISGYNAHRPEQCIKSKCYRYIAGVAALLILGGCAHNRDYEYYQLYSAQAPSKVRTISNIRQSALQDTANSIAAQAGLAYRSKQINFVLRKESRLLEQVFDFDAMLLDHNVLPPVLTEARDTLNLDNSMTIRLADRDYQIASPARFVTVAPTWRDYLWMNYTKPERPNGALLPQNAAERKLWKQYIKDGWNMGVQQAMDIFSANLGRLQRDFLGMILYRKLYAQNIVSAPFVSEADLGITGGGNAMRINDRVLRITAVSELNPDSNNWRAIFAKDKQPWRQPQALYFKNKTRYKATSKSTSKNIYKKANKGSSKNCQQRGHSLREILEKL